MPTKIEQILDPVAVREFAAKVSRYFLDFLGTDFKKTQAPRRRVQLRNEAGFRTGVPLRKYDTSGSVVVNNLKIFSVAAFPPKYDAPLIVGSDRVVTGEPSLLS